MGILEIFTTVLFAVMPHAGRLGLVRREVNKVYGRYGQMTKLTIDNANKKIEVELMLAGEKEPITVSVGKYNLAQDGSITLSMVSVSRAWMNLLAQELLANKAWPIPADNAKWLRMVL